MTFVSMEGTYSRLVLIACLMILSFKIGSAQRALDLANEDLLSISKQVNVEQVPTISIENRNGRLCLIARKGFKFVQIRNTCNFILVPSTYSARIVDVKELIQGDRKSNLRLDPKIKAFRIYCKERRKDKAAEISRCGKDCLGGGSIEDSSWISAGLLQSEAVIIPTYRKTR